MKTSTLRNSAKVVAFSLILGQAGLSALAPMARAQGESLGDVAQAHHLKVLLTKRVTETIRRHEKMNLDEIKAEMKAQIETSREKVKATGDLSTAMNEKLDAMVAEVEGAQTQQEIILKEKKALKGMTSAKNYMFAFCKANAKLGFMGGLGATLFSWIFAPIFDLIGIVLLIEPIMSAATGW